MLVAARVSCAVLGLAAAALGRTSPQTPSQTQPAPPQPMLLPQVIALPRGDRPLTIDGSLTDWPELPAIRMDDQSQVSGASQGAWRGPSDLSAIAFLMWDEHALYFACPVRDEWHRAMDNKSASAVEIPAADSILLTFDPGRDTRASGPDPGRRDDREFWLADEAGRQVVQWDRLRGTARVLDAGIARVVVLHDKERGVTSYEASIPWTEILPVGSKPSAGQVVDLQIVVNDFDESTDSMPQTRIGLTFGCGKVIDPGLFASMMLVADAGALHGVVPEFPPKPGLREPPLPPAAYWQQLTEKLTALPPAVYDGTCAPAECGGVKRLALLEEIDGHCAREPRIDHIEFHQRIDRNMRREVGGIAARGLPSWWQSRLKQVSKAAEEPVPDRAVRVFRLPMGGWLFRSATSNFVVDATGADLTDQLWNGAGFCVLTQPLDITRRNDQLLVRMALAEPPRTIFNHVVFHLPLVPMDKMTLAEQGKSYGHSSGARTFVLGSKLAEGAVTWSCSYRIELQNGPRILLLGPDLRTEEVEAVPVDVAIVSPRNPHAVEIVRKIEPELAIVDDAFTCQSKAELPRLSLQHVHALQEAMRPTHSVLLAPGEAWTVTAKNRQ
jgi:hypothetical protein